MGFLIVDKSGLDALRLRLVLAGERLVPAVGTALEMIGTEAVSRLSDAAPKGANPDQPPIDGDSEGPLAESFVSEVATSRLTVSTTQPAKLKFVREGRGEVYPLHPKAALFWQGLAHPVTHAGPAEGKDFVTPVVEDLISFAAETLSEATGEVMLILEE